MAKKEMDTTKKVQSCLEYIDGRLETTAEQTINIAETIIHDIKDLSSNYSDAMQKNQLKEHAEKVHQTQMKWVNQLHDIILEQTNRDLNGQVIQALQKFANNLNKKQVKTVDFDLPSAVARQNHDDTQYLNQDQIEALLASQTPADPTVATKHWNPSNLERSIPTKLLKLVGFLFKDQY